jgi:hypothetical protein
MQFGKNVSINGRWKYVSLNAVEIKVALAELLKVNTDEMKAVLHAVPEDFDVGEEFKQKIALAIAEKQMIASFTYLSSMIDQKAEKMRGEVTKSYDVKKVESQIGRKLGEPIQDKSAIDNAFESGG